MDTSQDVDESNEKPKNQERKYSTDSKSTKKSSSKGGRPKVEARISVEELRATFRKQMSLPGSQEANTDTKLCDPMDKCREYLGKKRGQTGLVMELCMSEPKCLWDEQYPECPERYTSVVHRCETLGLLSRCLHLPCRRASDAELLSQHSSDLIQLLRSTAGGTDVELLEEISSKHDTIYLHPKTSEMAELAAGSTIDLVEAVVKGKVHNGMALVRPPGHHAMHNTFCGYCFYNNVALAARHALDNLGVGRILIVDWDVHHGQATQQMFYDDDRVLYFSMHRYQHGSYWPHLRESNYDYTGTGAGRGYNCNVPLNVTGLGDPDYLSAWTQLLLPLAYQFGPDLVLVSAGYDAALGCFEGLMRVSPAFYCQLTSLLMPLAGGKLAVVLEGGYCLESLAEGAALTLRTLLGDPCPPLLDVLSSAPHPSLSESILNAITELRDVWPCLRYQGSYGDEAATERATRHARPKHVPVVQFLGPETKPTRFHTRDVYEKLSPEHQTEVDAELARLKEGTVLTLPEHRVCYVYDTAMEGPHCTTESGHPERPARTREIMRLLREYGLLDRMTSLQSRSATPEELHRVHSPALVSLISRLHSTAPAELRQLEQCYNSVYLHPDTTKAALLAAGSLLQVVESVVSGACSRGVAVVRPPGHHAEHDEPNGFCIYNNVAVAARHALVELGVQRVLIVDWDVHHGNGIQHAFEEDPRVLYVSLHVYRNATFFPNSTDANYDKLGRGDGYGYNINIPWQKGGVGDADYIAAFTQVVLPIAYHYAPQLVLVAAGFDAAVNDPVGGCEVSPECFGHLTHLLLGLAGSRVVLALEGGYNLVSTSHCLAMCVSALLGDPLPPLAASLQPVPHAVHTITAVLQAASQCWPTLRPYRAASQCWPTLRPYRVDLPVVAAERRTGRKVDAFPQGGGGDADSLTDIISAKMEKLDMGDGNSAGSGSSHPGASEEAGPSTSSGAGAAAPVSVTAVVSEEQLMAALAAASDDEDAATTIGQLLQQQQGGGYMVSPLSWCPHLSSVTEVPEGGLNVTDASCATCEDTGENWCCLTCYQVGCGRFVKGHALQHGTEQHHPLVLSYSDLSAWCYECQQYVHHQILGAAKQSAYHSKFGEDMPLTESWQEQDGQRI